MQTITKTTALAAFTLLGFASLATAQESNAAEQQSEQLPTFIPSDVLLNCKTTGPAQVEDSVRDAMIDVSSGRITALVMKSGAIARFDDISWNAQEKCLVRTEAKGADKKAVEAASSRGEGKKLAGENTFMLSSITKYPIIGFERTRAGRSDVELGSVGGSFVDVQSGHVAYVTTSVGGILGIGAESRVIPWSALRITRDAEGKYKLRSKLTAKRLEKAPAFGDGPDNLNNPEYRDTLYSFHGADRGLFEPKSRKNATLLTFARMQDATIVHGRNEEDSLRDLIVSPENGQVAFALSSMGKVIPVAALKWNTAEQRFHVASDVESSPLEANDSPILASKLENFTVMCGNEESGGLQNVYFNTDTGKIAYIAIDHEGTRVLPWSAISLRVTGEQRQLILNCTKETLGTAPALDGKVGATMYSPAFRKRADAVKSK